MRNVIFVAGLLGVSMAQAQMAVNFEWLREHRCSKASPALLVSGIPLGTTALAVKLIDNDVPGWNHGGGKVAVEGVQEFTIKPAALDTYNGPCPPNFSNFGHEYQFVVRAIDVSERELAQAFLIKTFSATKVLK